MKREEVTARAVKAANKRLYDTIAERYEEIDGRRSSDLEQWLRGKLRTIRQKAPGGRLLDIGTGSGLVTRCAEGIFSVRVGIDLSTNILRTHRDMFDFGVTADVDTLPFADNSIDVITCFAVLHHLYSFEGLVSEVARVLKPGGVFYSDHDMDKAFSKRFSLPLWLYRKLHNAKAKYHQANNEITPEIYELAEFQEEGIENLSFIGLLQEAEFSIEFKSHWYGLTPLIDKLFGIKSYPQGLAPLLSMQVIKKL